MGKEYKQPDEYFFLFADMTSHLLEHLNQLKLQFNQSTPQCVDHSYNIRFYKQK